MKRMIILSIIALLFASCVSTEGSSKQDSGLTAEDYNKRGAENAQRGNYNQAIADFTQAIRLAPNEADFYNNRGAIYININDNDRAIADYTQAIRLAPNNAAFYEHRGFAYNEKRDWNRAITDFTQAIRLNSNYAAAYSGRGFAYFNSGNVNQAIADFTRAVQLDPNNAEYRHNLDAVRQQHGSNTQNTDYRLSDEYKNAVRREFYRLVNEHRRANGLRILEVNSALERYADIRAAEQRIRFGHTRPDGSAAGSGWHNSQNFMNTRFAENAMSVGSLDLNPAVTANNLFTIWKNSSGHNRHMLYNFSPQIQMALGLAPELSADGRSVTSGAIWATGY